MHMEQIRGVVERITYADEGKGYSVIKIKAKNYGELVTVVGNMASVNVGAVITAKGQWTSNPKYGRQFTAESWEESVPATVYGIEKYLGSGLIRGIGPKFAKEIVNKFKEDTLRVIEEEPDRLSEVANIKTKRVVMIKKAWSEQKEIKNIMIFLQEHNVSTAFGYRIYKEYGDRSISVVKENPYRLADDIWGVGFKTADGIATKLGIDKESYARCRSGIFYTLNRFADEGHCFAYREDLVKKCAEILGVDESVIVMTLDNLMMEKELFREGEDMIFLPPFYFSENGVSKRVAAILNNNANSAAPDIDGIIGKLEKELGIGYDETQKEAIRLVTSSKISVLTGGPGTGKTTITKAIIEVFKSRGKTILLAAPTGRAAKRMSEMCKVEAKTIHRLLESAPPDGFARNEKNPLEGDVLIVDESSMIDILLVYNLLKAVPDNMTVVFVGDIDQLPSVGAGSVLGDFIESGVIPTVRLTKIFRQAEGSRIITNAHKVNGGQMPHIVNDKTSDFFFFDMDNQGDIVNEIVNLCANRLPKSYKINPVDDIQVLTPMRRSETGAENLNRVLQSAMNKNTLSLRRGGTEYKLGDKVMQIRNNYEKEIFNGDIGRIVSVSETDKKLSADFDGRVIEYDILELDELVLSYAVTIHKSQGGEFPIVIIPITYSHYMMLFRNLLYTGITRAKKLLILLGEKRAVQAAVRNNKSVKRNTMLAERLKNNRN